MPSDQQPGHVATANRYAALVLAGGEGTRIGTPKHLLRLPCRGRIDGEIGLLELALLGAAPLCPVRMVSLAHLAPHAVAQPEAQGTPGWIPVFDATGGVGPLAGILAAIEHLLSMAAAPSPPGWLLVKPVDTPFLPWRWLARCAESAAASGGMSAFLRSGDDAHYLCGAVHTSCLQDLRRFLASGQRAVRAFHAALAGQTIDVGDIIIAGEVEPSIALLNINTGESLETAKRLISTIGISP